MHNPDKPSLAELLLGLRRRINESAKKDPFKEELTLSQTEVLWFIGSEKKSMENIADFLHITPPSATGAIEKMEKKGLVIRERDKKDRRIIYIGLSDRTKKQFSELWKQKERTLDRIVSKLSRQDRKDLERILKTLIKK